MVVHVDREHAAQLTRTTSTRLSENVGARPSPDHASDEIEFTDRSERLRKSQYPSVATTMPGLTSLVNARDALEVAAAVVDPHRIA